MFAARAPKLLARPGASPFQLQMSKSFAGAHSARG